MNILIKNAKVVDGTGNPWFYSDIEIGDGKIRRMQQKLDVKADRTIDAAGLLVTPGFVDPHCHPEGRLVFFPELEEYVRQGITTQVMGSDGCAGCGPDKKTFLEFAAHWYGHNAMMYSKRFEASGEEWNSLAEFCQLVQSKHPATNAVPLVGISPILWKAGYRVFRQADARRLTTKEMETVTELVRQGLEQGAAGLTSTRDYPPDRFVSADEYIEPLKVVAKYGRVFCLHTKNLGTVDGVTEAIGMARKTGVELHILHLGVAPNWDYGNVNRLPEILGLIEGAREEGLNVTYDVMQDYDWIYRKDSWIHQFRFWCRENAAQPLKGSETWNGFVKNLEAPAYREEVKRTVLQSVGAANQYIGLFFNHHMDTVVLRKTGDDRLEGKTLGQVAREDGLNPIDLFFDIAFDTSPILKNKFDALVILPWTSGHPNEDNVIKASNHPLASPSCDTPILAVPREVLFYGANSCGTMPIYFRRSIASGIRLEEVIRKMTSAPARVVGLPDRGILRTGMSADITIFHPDEFRSTQDYDHPEGKAEGAYYVINNGRLVLDNAKLTGERPGQVLLRGRSTA